MQVSAADRQRAIAMAGRVAIVGGVLELRDAAGDKLGGDKLDAVLADAVARKRVAVEMDILAYEQGALDSKGGRIMNRKGVRVRDGALAALARSGRGTPFMRDHDQGNSLAKGGEVVASRLERDDSNPGHGRIMQTVRIVDPGAVERAARGLIGAVSIGLNPTGPVHCTACGTEIFSKCYHFPLDVVERDGVEHVVEWEFQDAELVETSECPIPAVQNAGPTSPIRAALAHVLSNRGAEPHGVTMSKIAIKLGLAATASEDEIVAAVDKREEALQAKLAIVDGERAALATEVAGYRAEAAKTEAAGFIRSALDAGKIAPADEAAWLRFYAADKAGAVEEMAKRAAGCATPVGRPPQRADAPPAAAAQPNVFKHGTMLARPGETPEQYKARRKAAVQEGN